MKIRSLVVLTVLLLTGLSSPEAWAYEFEVDSSGGRYVMRWTEINRAVREEARGVLQYWTCPDPAGRFYCRRGTTDAGQEIEACKCYAGGNGCMMNYSGGELKSVSCDVTAYVEAGQDFEWGVFLGPEYDDNQPYFALAHGTLTPSMIINWEAEHGDPDGDDVEGDDDMCPDVAGVADNDGCPEGDADHDGVVDDPDGDGINTLDETRAPLDNCPDVANADQADSDGDGIGDACDEHSSGGDAAGNDDLNPPDGGYGAIDAGEGCAFAGSAAANPALFLLLCGALLPLVTLRRR